MKWLIPGSANQWENLRYHLNTYRNLVNLLNTEDTRTFTICFIHILMFYDCYIFIYIIFIFFR